MRFVAMMENESDAMLEAWRMIVQKVNVVLREGKIKIKLTEEIVKQEEERRKTHSQS